MNSTNGKRGRPKKGVRLKADYLDIRLEATEKQAFRDAADLAGLDLSAWVRERLRTLARKELEAANQPVAFLAKVPDQLTEARCVDGLSVSLTFADQFVATVSLSQLGLAADEVNLRTAKATPAGLVVKSKSGRKFVIDSSTLRYVADPDYAARLDDAVAAMRIPSDRLERIAAQNQPPQDWYDSTEG
jgi:hypothetical protein